MRVTLGVDALEPNPGGIGRYTWQLYQGLALRDDIELRCFARGRFVDDPASLLLGRPPPRRRLSRLRTWWDRQGLRRSLFHGPNYFLPPSANGLVTIHDLSVFKYPETHPVERVRAFEREFDRSLGRATHIITDTETVRQELISEFNIAPATITAVHLGVEDRFRPQDPGSLQSVLAKLGLAPRQYALCVSTLEPRKRIGELLQAWRRLPPDVRSRFPLVLAGGAGWRNEQLQTAIDRGVAEGWLQRLGFVGEEDLPALYAGATLFLYPSIYEGFGLPPLEAMASGTPVIVSPRSCLPEVCGEAARYVDPDDPDRFLSEIMECLSDREWQANATSRGLKRAGDFTWDKCVDETVKIYRKVHGLS